MDSHRKIWHTPIFWASLVAQLIKNPPTTRDTWFDPWIENMAYFWCWEGLGAGGGTTEDEMAGWHHWLDGHESQWTPGVGVGQGGLACCDSWGRKESDTTERLIWSDLIILQRSMYILWFLALRVLRSKLKIQKLQKKIKE